PGTSTGPLIRAGLINQFTRLRDGDSFWYQNQSNPVNPLITALLASLHQPALGSTTLAAVIARNTEITNLQSNVFFFNPTISGTVCNDLNGNGVQDSGELYLTGRIIQLEDLAGNVIATQLTDGRGNYSFTIFDGIVTGRQYNVRVVPPSGWTVT